MKHWLMCCSLCLMLFNTAPAASADNEQRAQRAEAIRVESIEIAKLLRCPSSVNLTLNESDAMVASELKARIYTLLEQGKTREEVIQYMVERYGEQIRYEPSLNAGTAVLWLTPLMVVLAIAGFVILRVRRQKMLNRKI